MKQTIYVTGAMIESVMYDTGLTIEDIREQFLQWYFEGIVIVFMYF